MLRTHARTTTPLLDCTKSRCYPPVEATWPPVSPEAEVWTLCRGLELDSTNHVLLSNRSAAYIGLEDYELALQDANACLNANPDFVKGYSRQAVAYAKLNQPGFAEAAYRKGLAKDSSNAALKQGLAQLLQVSTAHSMTLPTPLSGKQKILEAKHVVYVCSSNTSGSCLFLSAKE